MKTNTLSTLSDFFDDIGREKLKAGAASMGGKNPQPESHGKRDPHGAFERRFAKRIVWARRWNRPRSSNRSSATPALKAIPKCPGAHLRYARILQGRE